MTKEFKWGDYVLFYDMNGERRQGRITKDHGKYWLIKSEVSFRYLNPIEIGGKIVGWKQGQDFIEYFVEPTDIIGLTDDPKQDTFKEGV